MNIFRGGGGRERYAAYHSFFHASDLLLPPSICTRYSLCLENSLPQWYMSGWKLYSFCHACRQVLRTLVIKMSLRLLLASCTGNSATSVNGIYTHSAVHVVFKNTCYKDGSKNATWSCIEGEKRKEKKRKFSSYPFSSLVPSVSLVPQTRSNPYIYISIIPCTFPYNSCPICVW